MNEAIKKLLRHPSNKEKQEQLKKNGNITDYEVTLVMTDGAQDCAVVLEDPLDSVPFLCPLELVPPHLRGEGISRYQYVPDLLDGEEPGT